MTPNQRDWLRSLARMAIRKTQKQIEKMTPKAGQTAGDFAAFKAKKRSDLEFQQATLVMLGEQARALPPADEAPHFPPTIDAVWHSIRDLEHWRTAGEFEDILHGMGVCLTRVPSEMI